MQCSENTETRATNATRVGLQVTFLPGQSCLLVTKFVLRVLTRGSYV